MCLFCFTDERDGDEGGIDIDMAEYYEDALEVNGGFKNATSAITAALQENKEPALPNSSVQQQQQSPCKDTKVSKVEDDIEMMDEDEPQTNVEGEENIPPPPQKPAATEQKISEIQDSNAQNCPQEADPQSETTVSEAISTAEEQSSNDEPTALESVPTVANPIVKPKRSNVRRSWKSPSVKVETPSRSLVRRSCNK